MLQKCLSSPPNKRIFYFLINLWIPGPKKPISNTFCCYLHHWISIKSHKKSWFLGTQPSTPPFILYSKREKQIQMTSTSKQLKQFKYLASLKFSTWTFQLCSARKWDFGIWSQNCQEYKNFQQEIPACKSYTFVKWCVIACKILMTYTTCHVTYR